MFSPTERSYSSISRFFNEFPTETDRIQGQWLRKIDKTTRQLLKYALLEDSFSTEISFEHPVFEVATPPFVLRHNEYEVCISNLEEPHGLKALVRARMTVSNIEKVAELITTIVSLTPENLGILDPEDAGINVSMISLKLIYVLEFSSFPPLEYICKQLLKRHNSEMKNTMFIEDIRSMSNTLIYRSKQFFPHMETERIAYACELRKSQIKIIESFSKPAKYNLYTFKIPVSSIFASLDVTEKEFTVEKTPNTFILSESTKEFINENDFIFKTFF